MVKITIRTMEYTRKDYLADLKSDSVRHTESVEHFQAFYDELGRDPVQHVQKFKARKMSFVVPKGRILELGCHWGFNCFHYAEAGFSVVGVDISETLIALANEKLSAHLRKSDLDLCFINSWIENLDVNELGKFDTIILTDTLEHVIDPLPVLQKAKDLLADDGKIYISCPVANTGTNSHVRGITQDQMRELFNKVGLELFSMRIVAGAYLSFYITRISRLANPVTFWNAVAKHPDWREYVLPSRTNEEFEVEGKLQAAHLSHYIKPSDVVFDYGCGVGRVTRYIVDFCAGAVGIDISEEFINLARSCNTNTRNLIFNLVEYYEDFKSLADVIYCLMVVQHNDHMERLHIMQDVKRLLKPGGLAIINFPKAEGSCYTGTAFTQVFHRSDVEFYGKLFDRYEIIEANLARYRNPVAKGVFNEFFLLAYKK